MKKLNKGFLYPNGAKAKVDFSSIPLKEYPRPSLVRDSYLPLNGAWDFALTKNGSFPKSFNQKIMVPYAVESPLSGIEKLVEPNEFMWYQRQVKIPAGFNRGKILIHFEGIDQTCEVFIDGKEVISHISGYQPFDLELPEGTKDEFTLTLKVQDVTDTSYHTRGKQMLKRRACFYSSSSGVYKPIWMESVPKEYVEELKLTPDFDKGSVKVLLVSSTSGQGEVEIEGTKYSITANREEEIKLSSFKPWSPSDPFLYQVKAKFGSDSVSSYFGLRKIATGLINGQPAILLNNQKIVLTGLLDQGYYYLGNLTPASYEDYQKDIVECKKLGFNVLRKHIKYECDMFYYYADKEGMLIIQDFPSGGRTYKTIWMGLPMFSNKANSAAFADKHLRGREDRQGQEEYFSESETALKKLYNHPSIIAYTIFNEGWGQFDTVNCYQCFKKEDQTRLFDSASGWYDTPASDLYSVHAYVKTHKERFDPYKKNRPYFLSEIGGASYAVKDHFFFQKVFGHSVCHNQESLEKAYKRLYEEDIIPLMEKGILTGTIYTELADCENECNGIFTFDRTVLKINPEVIKEINEKIKKISKCGK
jgi:beta-galactosidase/beta-glucuronidase